MAYLDEMGLTYLWGKIKSALNKKLDAALGLTQEEADERYLKLSGGEVTGTIIVKGEDGDPIGLVGATQIKDKSVWSRDVSLMNSMGLVTASLSAADNKAIKVSTSIGDPIRISGVNTPTGDSDAATKAYVDAAVAAVPTGETIQYGETRIGIGPENKPLYRMMLGIGLSINLPAGTSDVYIHEEFPEISPANIVGFSGYLCLGMDDNISPLPGVINYSKDGTSSLLIVTPFYNDYRLGVKMVNFGTYERITESIIVRFKLEYTKYRDDPIGT